MGLFYDEGFECSTARNLAYFFYCVFNESALFIRCVVSALERALKNSSVEQILLSRKAMLKGMDCLVWDGW